MPILALLPLIFAALKVILEIVDYLQAHPQIASETKVLLGTASNRLEAAHGALAEVANALPVQFAQTHVEAP